MWLRGGILGDVMGRGGGNEVVDVLENEDFLDIWTVAS
jgi:hypothetical protein